jgi:enterochelin esterase family protein
MKSHAALILMAAVCAAQGQQPPTVADRVVSPEVSGGRVTFHIYAPKAESVTLNGDWMKLGDKVGLTKDNEGVWSVTVGPLEPQVYLYSFNVDGMNIADPVNPRIKLRARTSASLVEVPGNAPWIYKDVPHGKVEMITQKSKVLGDVREVFVYTPPGYDSNRKQRYPVLYLFHGNNDVAAGWTWTGRAHVIMDNLLAEGKVKPMLLVMPWAHAAPYGAPGAQNTELFERYLLEDIVPLAEANYRTAKGSANRAIAGLSMGASHSLHIGLRHPDLFGNIGLFSMGGMPRDFEEVHKPALADAKGSNAKLKVFWIAIGKDDGGLERNRALRATLKKHGIRFTESEGEGGHFYPVFRRELAEFAPMLFQR